jgi:hypothetical protein
VEERIKLVTEEAKRANVLKKQNPQKKKKKMMMTMTTTTTVFLFRIMTSQWHQRSVQSSFE